MYDYIKGTITSISPTSAVIEAGGVGYSLSISLTTNSAISPQQQFKLYTHLYQVQDQAPALYGFATQQERALFRLLISVSGIGGNTALVMLSSHSTQQLVSIISSGDAVQLTRVKGIGAKTAQVVIVKLADKVAALSGLAGDDGSIADGRLGGSLGNGSQALDALMVLGFSRSATEKVVRRVAADDPSLSVEDIIRKTLSLL